MDDESTAGVRIIRALRELLLLGFEVHGVNELIVLDYRINGELCMTAFVHPDGAVTTGNSQGKDVPIAEIRNLVMAIDLEHTHG